jgi:hypothetical protein
MTDGEPDAGRTLSTTAVLVVVLGESAVSPGLLRLTDLARESAVPLLLATRRQDLCAPSSVVEYAHSCAAAEFQAGRGEQHAALYARVAEVVASIRQRAGGFEPIDQAMMSQTSPAGLRGRSDPAMVDTESDWALRWGLDLGTTSSTVTLDKSAPEASLNRSTRATADTVHFGVTCPESLGSPDAAIVDVWAFPPGQRQRILEIAREERREPPTLVTQGPARVARGTQLHARLWFEDLHVPDPVNSILWDGEIAKTTFVVKVPSTVTPGAKRGTVTILHAGIPVARLSCLVKIVGVAEARAARPTRTSFDSVRRRKAFASYASRDRRDVLARVQGLEKAGVDVFVDVKNLRSGEHYESRLLEEIASRDVFYLFWSKAASVSEWVEKEWRFALARRGLNFIDPIPLAAPERVPPPQELAGTLHFADWTTAYAAAMASAPRRWWQIWR